MSDFSPILVLQFKPSVNRTTTWQREQSDLGNSHLPAQLFQSWRNLTPCYHLLLTQHWVIDAAVSSDTRTAKLFVL